MNYTLCQTVQFLFSLQMIISILGSVFFYIIQKIRYKYMYSLPTRFHCILLKSAMTFFLIPNTVIIIYLFYSMYLSEYSFQKNICRPNYRYSIFIFHFFILTVLIIGSLKKTVGYIKLTMQLKQYCTSASYQTTNPVILEPAVHIHKRYGIRRTLPIHIHPYIPSPSISGILSPKILLPEHIALQASQETLQIILSHEMLHHKKKDIFWYYISVVMQCIYWYLPSVKILCTELKSWLEYECDEYCCKENKKHYSKQDYFNTILELLSSEKYSRNYILGVNFYKNKHQVEERILYMHAKKDTQEKRTIFCLLILLALLSTYLFSLALSLAISLQLI